MKLVSHQTNFVSAGRIVSAVTMICLLLFLTCANQFVYSGEKDTVSANCNGSGDDRSPVFPNSPAGPDEKSPDAPVSVNEELMHYHETHVNPFLANHRLEHGAHQADKLCVVHLEQQTPPPNA
jgi:hypothetical protein